MKRQHEQRGTRRPGPPGQPDRVHSRPWQAISALSLALAAAVAVHLAGIPLGVTRAAEAARLNHRVTIGIGHLITISGAIVFFVLSLISTFAFARWARAVLERFVDPAYGAIVRYAMILIGISVVVLTTLSMLGFRVAQLVVGGALTGVLITIAAQQALSNLFAGVMLQFAHPFRVGDRVWVRSGALGGTVEGLVTEFSLTYVRIETGDGPVFLPNSQVLAAAVSPVRQVGLQALASPPPDSPGPPPGTSGPPPGTLALGWNARILGGLSEWPAPAGCRPPCQSSGRLVIRLVLGDDLRRNPAAIADLHA